MSEQQKLFELPAAWSDDWAGMPAFEQRQTEIWQEIIVRFRNKEDRDRFAVLIEQPLTSDTHACWFPKREIKRIESVYASDKPRQPRYPIYVISKGRWESRLTVKALERMNVAYRLVIEPQEFEQYAAVIATEKIFVLPFSNLGQGSIPARNWVWDHAQSIGAERHWILDDNIRGFCRQHEGRRIPVEDSAIICAMEDFVDRYENIALAGPNYRFFAPAGDARIPPFYVNTRVYSCILIKTALDYRWRGRYNEDTDLSLRMLKDGHCTILFNAFKIDKIATMTMKGGNTDELYKEDGRLKMAQSLVDQHPDCVSISWKWNRYQHHVDYRRFRRNLLKRKTDLFVPQEVDEFGMTLKQIMECENPVEDSENALQGENELSLEEHDENAATTATTSNSSERTLF